MEKIELMHSYPSFPNDAIFAFKELTVKYNFAISTKGICSIDFVNDHCRLNFNMDRWDLQALLYKSQDNFAFGIQSISLLLNPDYYLTNKLKNDATTKEGRTKSSLNYYANITKNCLSSVLDGDFSWYDIQKAEVIYKRKLVGLIHERFDHNHPIVKKFWKQDPTWRMDVEDLIKREGISLE